MKNIKTYTDTQNVLCVETTGPPAALVVFGASGDLSSRKLLPGLIQICQKKLLNENFYLLGAGRKKFSDEQFRENAKNTIKTQLPKLSAEEIETFVSRLYYVSGDYKDISFYENIKTRISQLDADHKVDGNHIFYLAVPPFLYVEIVEKLHLSGLSCAGNFTLKKQPKLVVEKPFGKDLQSARKLDSNIRQCFNESQIYRIDHYLGKETVQNILIFRFANTIFEPLWNRNYIDHVQITTAESIGVEHRGSYYDKSGALRDMFQNHMLQMLALAAMEPPGSFSADSIRDEKVKLLRSIRPFKFEPWTTNIVRGQYAAGAINDKDVIAYTDEAGVEPDSKTETFVAAKFFIDNWRWQNVPFYLRTGKRMANKNTEIAITFKEVPHSMFALSGLHDMPPNTLILRIQPQEGTQLSFQAKSPGAKLCMNTLNMNFNYHDVFGVDMPEAYHRLLLDCMLGDQTLFNRSDDVEITWELLTPILHSWQDDQSMLFEYPAGAQSFTQADNLIESDGRNWRSI